MPLKDIIQPTEEKKGNFEAGLPKNLNKLRPPKKVNLNINIE